MCIEVSLWGDICDARKYQVGKIIALKACRVSDYSGRSLNASGELGDIFLEPDNKRAGEIKRWAGGSSASELKNAMRSLTTNDRQSSRTMLMAEMEQ